MAWYIVAKATFSGGLVALGPFERREAVGYQQRDRALPRPSWVIEAPSEQEAVAKAAEHVR